MFRAVRINDGAYFVDLLCLLDLGLQELLDGALHDLATLLHTPSESCQGFFQFSFHLRSDVLVLFADRFKFSAEGVERSLKTAGLVMAQRLSAQVEELLRIFVFDRRPGCPWSQLWPCRTGKPGINLLPP
jgi:hypothetical protein